MINALSAHNPLGSVKGTGEKTSLAMYFHLSLLFKGHDFLLAKFKGQKPEYLPSNAFKRTLVLISVSSITLKSLTRNCSYISLLLILTQKEYVVSVLHLL